MICTLFFLKTETTIFTVFLLVTVLMATLVATDGFSQQVELDAGMFAAGSSSDRLPFWTAAHRDGLLNEHDAFSGLFVLGGRVPYQWGQVNFEAGTRAFIRRGEQTYGSFNELYLSAAYGALHFYGGRKAETQGSHHPALSSGSMAWSRNATPLPKLAISLPDYVDIPFTRGYAEIKGRLAHGWFDDPRFTTHPQLHEKSLFMRFGGDSRIRGYGGLIHYVVYGGTTPGLGKNPATFSDYLRILFFREGDDDSNYYEQEFALGDHIGTWDFGLEFFFSGKELWLYRQFIIETKKELLFNTPQDGLLGLALTRENPDHWWSSILWEFLYTKFQNGPWWAEDPDRPPGKSGQKNYYNHYLYQTGWTYHGRTIGIPLLYPRLEGGIRDQKRIENNRIIAHHFGVEGRPDAAIYYRAMFTYSRNYGTYRGRDLAEERGEEYFWSDGPEQFSLLLETEYTLPGRHNLVMLASVGADFGRVFPDRIGLLAGLRWSPAIGR